MAPERCNLPAASIRASSDAVIIVDINAPAAHIAQHKWQPNTPDGHGAPFLFQHGKAFTSSAGRTFMQMFKGKSPSVGNDWQFPQALAFASSGIGGKAVVSITHDKEIITGKHSFHPHAACVRILNSGIRCLHFLPKAVKNL